MSDSQPAYDEQLPWLEAVDDEDGPPGISARRMLAALAIVLAAAILVAAGFYWIGNRTATTNGAPELIRAEPGPFKVKPENPGGLDVTGDSETAYETSAGQDPDSRLDLDSLPEQPVARPEPPAKPPASTAPAPAASGSSASVKAPPEPVEKVEAPAPAAGGSGSVIQLGAYTSSAQAQRGWDALSSRFEALAGLNKMIVPYSGGYRLRAGAGSPEDARRICQALKVAGENCFVAR